MKRFALLIIVSLFLAVPSCDTPESRDYYQIKIYQLADEVQEADMDQYLENALLPALHRAGFGHIGVFKPIEGENEGKKFIMVLIPFQSFAEIELLDGTLLEDQTYQEDGKAYIEASHEPPPYVRIESVLLRSFSAMPQLAIPDLNADPSKRVYELRSYEGATERLYERKVEMFNEAGEVALFQELGFNPVFFGEVLSSSHMPHLMYMITFSDTLSQQQHWDAFRVHPDWLEMKDMERYSNTVSSITKYLMYPTDYSDI